MQTKTHNLSLSGYKVIFIMNILEKKPHSEQELNDLLKKNKIAQKGLSDDEICLYINTLKKIGCKIKRPSKSNGYKYEMVYNPFRFTPGEKEKNMLPAIIKYLSKINDWKFIFDVDEVFQELQKFSNLKKDEILISLSSITDIDKKIILKLNEHCQKKNVITIFQKVSYSDDTKKITILADELFLENEKLYIWGYNFKQQEMQYFRVDKIFDIKKVGITQNEIIIKKPTAKYRLTKNLVKTFKTDENQQILSKSDNEMIIEEQIINRFKFIQKILSLGDECTLLSPVDIVDEIKLTLETLEQIYEN